MSALRVPEIDPGRGVLVAALAYAGAGFLVGPVRLGSKNPGSVLGKGWQEKTTRDPAQIEAWFEGTDYGVFLHAGDDCVILDVDQVELVPQWLWPHLESAPFQSSRSNEPLQGHYLFLPPPGRRLGNSAGGLTGLDVRGRNGVIIVEPTPHVAAAAGGRYQWMRTGVVPVLPDEIAAVLPVQGGAPAGSVSEASDADVAAFLDSAVAWIEDDEKRGRRVLRQIVRKADKQVAAGSARHDALRDMIPWLMDNAAAGVAPARESVEVAREWWDAQWVSSAPGKRQDPDPGEFTRAVSWAVGKALAKSGHELAARYQRALNANSSSDGDGEGDAAGGAGRRALRDRLVDLAESSFRIGRDSNHMPFLVDMAGPNVALYGSQAKGRLAARMRADEGVVPSEGPLREAWTAITGIAEGAAPEELPLRVGASPDGAVAYLDLCTVEGHCVEITAAGWKVLGRSPVTFRRTRAQAALPIPDAARGGAADLWRLVNVSPDSRDLVWAWLIAALIRDMPHPILQMRGSQGSAKSMGTEFLSRVIDPGVTETIEPPRDEARWQVAVNARWMLGIDNVSTIQPWWSDALCRTSTGSGSLARALYTDSDVVAMVNKGAVILNGISLSSALRSDLAERLLPLELERPTAYLTQGEVRAAFKAAHAGILAALLTDTARVMAALEVVESPTQYRMADFARLLAAADCALGAETLKQYGVVHEEAADDALEGDVIALAVLRLVRPKGRWSGTASQLMAALRSTRNELITAGDISDVRGYWPANAKELSQVLTRSTTSLKRGGVTFTKRRTKSARVLEFVCDEAVS